MIKVITRENINPGWDTEAERAARIMPTRDDYQRAVDAHIDAVAEARSYASAVSCVSYILPDPNAEGVTPEEKSWDAEGRAFQRWRNAVWKAVFAAMAAWHAGGEPPSIDELIAGLPVMEWPEA